MFSVLRCLVVIAAAGVCSNALAQEDYLNHVVFTNSLTPDSDFYTQGNAVPPSILESPGGRLPVDRQHFMTPPNALRMTWRSLAGGSWDAEIRTVSYDNRPSDFRGTVLSFWVWAPQRIAAADLPQVQMLDDEQNFTMPLDIGRFAGELRANHWQQVRIPLARFTSYSVRPFDAHKLHSLFFAQGRADGESHTLVIDEIRIDPEERQAAPDAPSPLPAPHDLEATAYERHVDLHWTSPSTQAEYYTIYRSENGESYKAIGIARPGFNRYMDFIGAAGVKATYKVAAVDHAFRQTRFSREVTAETHAMSDDELLTMVEQECFRYYWERGSHPAAGMALESVPGDPRMVATGASGFGIMAIVVGMERGFITEQQGFERLEHIVGFLEKADRFHGAWPHFMNGDTGRMMPVFGMFDNGGDLVETSFLMEGLLVARSYLNGQGEREHALAARIGTLWEGVEWDWYARRTEDPALIWHWSPQWTWRSNHRLTGFNETMAAYLLAIASPTHGIDASYYYNGWAGQSEAATRYRIGWSGTSEGDHYKNGHAYEGVKLDVGVGDGGPLFFTQYSFMGPDPHLIRDKYTDYFTNNRNIALINYRYCVANQGHYKGYAANSWGLTASLNPYGYGAQAPNAANDNGTIAPTAALGSFAYTPDESMAALKHFYRDLGDRLWGIYGPMDAFNLSENWFAPSYLALDQAPIVVMIENHRSGSIWKLFAANPEMAPMLAKIGANAPTQNAAENNEKGAGH